MRLQGKDRDVWLTELERAHRDGGTSRAIASRLIESLVELRGNGIGWAGDKVTAFALVGAMAACRDYRRRSFLPSKANRRKKPLRVPAYIGPNRMESLSLAEVIASAADDEARAYTLLAVAKEKRRLVKAAEAEGRRTIGTVAA